MAAGNGPAPAAAMPSPYFRIFNPVSQRKFDAEGRFIRRYVPVLAGLTNSAIHAPLVGWPAGLASANVVTRPELPATHRGPRTSPRENPAALRGRGKTLADLRSGVRPAALNQATDQVVTNSLRQ